MASESLVLGFDTSASHCATALLCNDTIIASASEAMSKGQAERLMPLMEELLSGQGLHWKDLHRIGVGVGPGNFSGVRISVSAARGLALALKIPAIGINTFQATALSAPEGALLVVPAPQDQLYVSPPGAAPCLAKRAEAERLGSSLGFPPPGGVLAANIARLAAQVEAPFVRPAPLYIRQASAAPSKDTPPVILDD